MAEHKQRGARVGILGYYGGDKRMIASNYLAMVRECREIIEKDFQLPLHQCGFVGTGGTWSAHIPIDLWKSTSWSNAENVCLILGAQFDLERRAFDESSKLGAGLNTSHTLMHRRLLSSNRSQRTIQDIAKLIECGAHVMFFENINDRETEFQEACDYLIYLPLDENDQNVMHGSRIYKSFTGPKRVLAWSDMFAAPQQSESE